MQLSYSTLQMLAETEDNLAKEAMATLQRAPGLEIHYGKGVANLGVSGPTYYVTYTLRGDSSGAKYLYQHFAG
jgi:hypothetical protein